MVTGPVSFRARGKAISLRLHESCTCATLSRCREPRSGWAKCRHADVPFGSHRPPAGRVGRERQAGFGASFIDGEKARHNGCRKALLGAMQDQPRRNHFPGSRATCGRSVDRAKRGLQTSRLTPNAEKRSIWSIFPKPPACRSACLQPGEPAQPFLGSPRRVAIRPALLPPFRAPARGRRQGSG